MDPLDPDDISASRKQRRDDLLDDLIANPIGLTVDDMMVLNGWSHQQANTAIRDLRRALGDTDTMNLTCDPQSKGDRWLYRLVGNLDDIRGWAANRVRDTESRVRTMEAMMRSIVSATNGRTIEGRKARLINKAFTRLVEDLDDLIAAGSL